MIRTLLSTFRIQLKIFISTVISGLSLMHTMAGIYIHIPFCKQKCTYCDFHFTTSLKYKNQVLNAMFEEIQLKKNYFEEPIETIYFGGGTPSFIEVKDIENIIQLIYKNYDVNLKELTLEANPDDLSKSKLADLKSAGINRLSIGIQTFNEGVLKWMNRSHSSQQAIQAVKTAQDTGFENISIDLIYAIPSLTLSQWEEDILKVIDSGIQHISAYNLTVEQKTILSHQVNTGKVCPVSDEIAAQQFDVLIDLLTSNGFSHYEISNFGLPGYYSQHNSGYWKQKKYIGIGPSAHSYNGTSRQWNLSNNIQYYKSIENNESYFEEETLTNSDIVNEYLLTGLRTEWGCDLKIIRGLLPTHLQQIKDYAGSHKDLIIISDSSVYLTKKGRFYADRIISDLFV